MKKLFFILTVIFVTYGCTSMQKQKTGWIKEAVLDVTEYAHKMFPGHNYGVWDKEYTQNLPHYYTSEDTVASDKYYKSYWFKDLARNVSWKIEESKNMILIYQTEYDKNGKEVSYFSAGWTIKSSRCDTCWTAIFPVKQVKKHKVLFKEATELFAKK